MRSSKLAGCAMALAIAWSSGFAIGQSGGATGQQAPPTFHVTSKLVFLDVTVLDRKGRPVVTGLTKDDFLITEDRRPQQIFSFEPPNVHTLNAAGENPEGKAPVTILVLDELNSRWEDFAYNRGEVQRYLNSQPKELASPTEMLIVGQESLELVQGFTRDRQELLDALKHIPPALPYKQMGGGGFVPERIHQSFDALEQIALESQGIPGRKNIIWVGHGGPRINTAFLPTQVSTALLQYAHSVTNMLVDSRITLFVLYPGLRVNEPSLDNPVMDAAFDPGDNDLFGAKGDVNFGIFADETGGKLFFNRNNIDAMIRDAERMGSEYYTLTYQPHGGNDDGRFRRIHVTMRDPNLRAVTKIGYYAPDRNAPADPMQQRIQSMVEAVQATVPFHALPVSLSDVLRHPDADTTEVLLQVQTKDLHWLPNDDGTSATKLLVATAALNQYRDILKMRAQTMTWTARTQDPVLINQQLPLTLDLTIPATKKTRSIRIAVETENGGRVGAVEVSRALINAAPAVPTPQPHLAGPRPGSVPASLATPR